ncbi:chromosome segregation protein SMC [Verrucomicrobiota bacterium]
MYLKCIELSGFKSFGRKTKLAFEPGMTAIVGPNGCGKSNIADSLRWVLGEQSAKALRGSKMEDCIFNGTDARKPVSMAEVSVTFSDCEKSLQLDYNEVTVTRRVFRSGEGQYFLNKRPCRLKDIQRLFMDTGVGTTSYSLMEQGRIDRVLSSRPEDRRAVFEEASGITKFKADRKEAILKLDHTEANLLRLSDVIREVKRQIGSLQRQAGKARRYKALRKQLRGVDIFLTKHRLDEARGEIEGIEAKIRETAERVRSLQLEVDETEAGNAVLRDSVVRTEREIGTVLEAGVEARTNLEHAHEMIRVNGQRIEEYKALTGRDSGEIDDIRAQLAEKSNGLAELEATAEGASSARASSESLVRQANEQLAEHQKEMEAARSRMQALREEAVELESRSAKLQNRMVELESSQRAASVRRERLAAEKVELSRVLASYDRRQVGMDEELAALDREAGTSEAALLETREQRSRKTEETGRLREELAELKSQAAAGAAQIDMLRQDESAGTGFPRGARLLLDEAEPLIDRSRVLGALADRLEAEKGHERALEAAARAWLDAVLVKDAAGAREALAALESKEEGPARILSADPGDDRTDTLPPDAGNRLIDHVRCPDELAPVARALFGRVLVADGLDAIPDPVPPETTYVTLAGSVVRPDGMFEFWSSDGSAPDPLSRRHRLAETESRLSSLAEQVEERRGLVETLDGSLRELEERLSEEESTLNDKRRALAQKQGESQVVTAETDEARRRLETVSWELRDVGSEGSTGESEREAIQEETGRIREQRERIAGETGKQGEQLKALEDRHVEMQAAVAERRIAFAEARQKVEGIEARREAVQSRIGELERALETRTERIRDYKANIARLETDIGSAEARVTTLQGAVEANAAKSESLRRNREKQSQELAAMEQSLAGKRTELDETREAKSGLDLHCSECRMRRQNQLERLTNEYGMTAEQIAEEPPPEWEGEPPSLENVETMVTELRTKIEAMGPVNLVAIEEFNELQERHAFLTAQEQDLVNSKKQLMDMIRKINRTTSELFRTTFEAVNANFDAMFQRLFDGGTAKLVMVDEEDVLETGIEIIARPPGKRLQNVSLLSGGERTLTAVALLFAIYMIKPSPFCLLDELDAALDDSNIGRFVQILQGFLGQSQFVVITHNRQTISAADVLYGITMQEKGISSIVSMRFNAGQVEPVAQP